MLLWTNRSLFSIWTAALRRELGRAIYRQMSPPKAGFNHPAPTKVEVLTCVSPRRDKIANAAVNRILVRREKYAPIPASSSPKMRPAAVKSNGGLRGSTATKCRR